MLHCLSQFCYELMVWKWQLIWLSVIYKHHGEEVSVWIQSSLHRFWKNIIIKSGRAVLLPKVWSVGLGCNPCTTAHMTVKPLSYSSVSPNRNKVTRPEKYNFKWFVTFMKEYELYILCFLIIKIPFTLNNKT